MGPLLVPMKPWGWLVGKEVAVEAPPLHATQQWYLASMVTQRSASIASSRKVRNVFVASSENIPSCGTPYSYPFILSFHSQQLSPPWVLSSNTTFHHSAPVCTRRHRTQAGVCRQQHRSWAQFLLCPAFYRPVAAFLTNPLSALAYFPTVNGLFWVWEPLFTFSSSPGVLVPSCFLFLFFLSFILPGCMGILLVLLGVWSSASV